VATVLGFSDFCFN